MPAPAAPSACGTPVSPHVPATGSAPALCIDPKGSLGGAERVHVIARKGFGQDHPEVLGFLARLHLPLDELQEAMYEATQTSYEEAAAAYIENNPARIEYWVSGEIQ
ncbi:MAG: hypothetical protein EA406_05090 [Rhodospirillales bacterium]|nr:MAG: hypothetical protein EA406_05090 [Rhodospirillales bacterium]